MERYLYRWIDQATDTRHLQQLVEQQSHLFGRTSDVSYIFLDPLTVVACQVLLQVSQESLDGNQGTPQVVRHGVGESFFGVFLLQLSLCLPEFGGIEIGAEEILYFPLVIALDLTCGGEIAQHSVCPDDAELEIKVQFLQRLFKMLTIIGVDELQVTSKGRLESSRGYPVNAVGFVGPGDMIRGCVIPPVTEVGYLLGSSQPVFAGAQSFFRLFALRYVAQDHGNQSSLPGLQCRQGCLDGEFLAILPYSLQFADGGPAGRAGFLERHRNKPVNRASYGVSRRTAEHPLGRCVEKQDAPVRIGGNDCVQGRSDYAGQPCPAFLQFLV